MSSARRCVCTVCTVARPAMRSGTLSPTTWHPGHPIDRVLDLQLDLKCATTIRHIPGSQTIPPNQGVPGQKSNFDPVRSAPPNQDSVRQGNFGDVDQDQVCWMLHFKWKFSAPHYSYKIHTFYCAGWIIGKITS